MPESRQEKVACPSCGVSLLFEPGVIAIRCQFCNAAVERPIRDGGPAVLRADPARPHPREPQSGFSRSQSSSMFIRIAFMLASLLTVGLIGLAVYAILSQASRSGSDLSLIGPIAMLPTDQIEGPDFISLAYDLSGGKYLFARVNPARGEVVWRGKKVEEISDVQTIVVGNGAFFSVKGTELHAYRSSDGSDLWQAELSDKLGYCDECLSVSGERAIVLTQDYVIQAFDTETGTSAWKRRMDGYTSGFTLADGGLWVIDKVDGMTSLLFLALADGAIQRQITPECRAEDDYGTAQLDSTSMLVFDPDPATRSSERSIYLLYGWHPGCVDRWDSSTAALLWQRADPDGFSPSKDFATLFTPDYFFFAYEDLLWSVAKTDGQIRELSAGGDYELAPLALEQGTLILRTKRTRGTTQFGLRGMNPRDGETLWEYSIRDSEPLEPPDAAFGHVEDDQSIWTWRILDGQLRVLNFQADPNQAKMDSLNPKDGISSGEKTLALPISGDSYFGPKVMIWKENVVWIVADSQLIAIDVSILTVKYKFPSG